MKPFTLIILVFFVASTCLGQAITYYTFNINIYYLPGGDNTRESYIKNNDKLKHTLFIGSKKKRKTKNLAKDALIEKQVNQLDSLRQLDKFTFVVNKSFIDSLKTDDPFWKSNQKITDKDIESYFLHGDTVTLNMRDTIMPQFEGMVIDGAPYNVNLVIKRNGNDTVKYSFYGNLCDYVDTRNIKNWLSFYLVYRDRKIFQSLYLDDYFNEKKLESIFHRFLDWKTHGRMNTY